MEKQKKKGLDLGKEGISRLSEMGDHIELDRVALCRDPRA